MKGETPEAKLSAESCRGVRISQTEDVHSGGNSEYEALKVRKKSECTVSDAWFKQQCGQILNTKCI